MPKPPKPQEIPERQALKLPDGGSTAPRVEDGVRRRRAMMTSVFSSLLGQGSGPSTTTVLGG
ncbi:hypothetical protein NDN01_24815 [Sphingomonas sp. QA11]|uniref:hypothetical protein n=1 Tax=Sphingomonas sp. QA11 TaxID=2950605 RepID=UPI00234A01CC|nr:MULTISPECIES: hypothetical protein [unclassified Sphingomonas]WCM27165.1 hypothetical protein NDN01_24815 [Sphingomonas sp. QA11]WEJ98284.1 MAG: hypothetical protein P0Y59_15170 [Sphingomonas sp.]